METPEPDHTPTVRLASLRRPSSSAVYLPNTPAVTPPPSGELSKSVLSTGLSVGRTSLSPAAVMPRPGDAFFGFRLADELGHGTFARVFLAKQESLAGRDVALKVTLKPTREAERLARLLHTNIVPVYSVHTAPPVQIICMPYLGRRTIADVLTGYRKSHVAAGLSTRRAMGTKKGSSSLSGSRSRISVTDSPSGSHKALAPTSPVPTGSPLVGDTQAVLKVLLQLASGLAHAHERGILHLDLKPANVLLADSGEPMLLDFNLSFDATEENREVVGGTIPYMAPEQLLDLRTRGKGQIDARTDLYSLGVMAFEMFTGHHPFAASSRSLADFDALIAARMKGAPSLRDTNADITPAVEAIVHKLLAPKPEDRYQSAADLHDDLERQLNDRPLRFAADRSVAERVGKWRRRNPRALLGVVAAVFLAVAGGTGAFAYNKTETLATRDAEARAQRTREELDTIRLDLVLPGDAKARERGTKRALEILRQYGLPDDPNWQKNAAFRKLPEADRSAVGADLGELLLLVANARWEDGKAADRTGAAADALTLNQLAEGCFADGSVPPFLARQRAELEAVGSEKPTAPVSLPKAVTARDHFLDAVGIMADEKFEDGVPVLQRAVAGQPGHGAAQFCLAYCWYKLNEHLRAVERFETAQVLMPTDPRPLYFAGIAYGMSRKPGAAEDAFTRAIELDPDFGPAYRDRGLARTELGRLKEAERDFTDALIRSVIPLRVYVLRASVRDRLGDVAGAAADRRAMATCRPESEFDFLTLGHARMVHDPKGALADFRTAAEKNPRSLQALQYQTYLLSDVLHDGAAALVIANRMVELYPNHIPARAERAIQLARLGRGEEARREAEQCRRRLDALPVKERDHHAIFRLACVYSLTSKGHPGDRTRAFALLREALRTGFCEVRAFEKSPDLDPIRGQPEFAPLLEMVKELSL